MLSFPRRLRFLAARVPAFASRLLDEDTFAELQAAEVDRRLRFPDPFKHARHSAFLDGFSLHAGVRIHENDREGLERLCRYAVRPPFALHRLPQRPEGRLLYKMKRARGGSHLLLPLARAVEPEEAADPGPSYDGADPTCEY